MMCLFREHCYRFSYLWSFALIVGVSWCMEMVGQVRARIYIGLEVMNIYIPQSLHYTVPMPNFVTATVSINTRSFAKGNASSRVNRDQLIQKTW